MSIPHHRHPTPHPAMHPSCAVGTRGWDHAQWTGRYYPDDLPSSWRLSFYANDFTGVLVPAVQWRAAGRATLARWRQDVPAGFRFFFETEMGARPPQPPADWLQEVLGETFGGWVGPGDETPCAGLRAANLDAIVDAGIDTGIDTGQRHSADVVLVRPGDLAERRRLGTALAALARQSPVVKAVFLLDDLDPEPARELRVLAELVGLA